LAQKQGALFLVLKKRKSPSKTKQRPQQVRSLSVLGIFLQFHFLLLVTH